MLMWLFEFEFWGVGCGAFAWHRLEIWYLNGHFCIIIAKRVPVSNIACASSYWSFLILLIFIIVRIWQSLFPLSANAITST